MALKDHRVFLTSEIAAVEDLLGGLVPHDVFGRLSLAERLENLRTELQALGDESEDREIAETEGLALLFDGDPVVSGSAIEADFGTKAIAHIQEVAAQLNARREGRELAMAGPIPLRKESRLYITGVKAGSFGFVLDEAPGQTGDGATSIRPILQDIARLIVSASESEEALDETVPSLDQRTLNSLRDFFTHVGNGNASLHLISGQLDRNIGNEDLKKAAQRVSEVHITDERVLELKGRLLGILPEARQFEFIRSDNEQTIRGRVSRRLSYGELLTIAERIAYKSSVATFLQTRVLRGAHPARLKYELQEITLDPDVYKDAPGL